MVLAYKEGSAAQVRVEVLSEASAVIKALELLPEPIPFFRPVTLSGFARWMGDEPLLFVLYEQEAVAAIALFMVVSKDGYRLAYSKGRFGCLGFRCLGHCSAYGIEILLYKIEKYFRDNQFTAFSLANNPMNEVSLALPETEWITTKLSVYLCRLGNFFSPEGRVMLPGHLRRNILSRIKKGRHHGYHVLPTREPTAIDTWHQNCHIPRMGEIGGKIWPRSIFQCLGEDTENSLFALLDSHDVIVGGCYVLMAGGMGELFMMSTPEAHQKQGGNYVLTDEIYRTFHAMGGKIINWQDTNPPNGGVAEFKKKWAAAPVSFPVVTAILDRDAAKGLDPAQILERFPERFVIPFSWYKSPDIESSEKTG